MACQDGDQDQRFGQLVAAKVTAGATVSTAQIQAYWQASPAKLRNPMKTATFEKEDVHPPDAAPQAQSKLWTALLSGRISKLSVTLMPATTPLP